jgi:hypothetical protein
MEWRGLGSFQHTQGKTFKVPHFEKIWFSKVFILHTHWSALSIGAILGQLDEESKEYESLCNPKATTRLRTTTLHTRGCRNPNLGLTTKARACKGAGQERSPGVMFHAPRSVRECEGMNPHIPKWAPILGVGVPVDSQIFKERLQGSKLIGLKSSLYHWKSLQTLTHSYG